MNEAAPLFAMAAIFAAGIAGAWALRTAWRMRGDKAGWRLAGLTLLLLAIAAPAWALGAARGPFIALAIVPVAVLLVVAAGHERRTARAPRAGRESLAPEPAERPSAPWRGVLRWLLAGPIGMVAAMAVGVCYTVWAPGATQTRLVIGGLIVPVAWGAAMAWTLADSRVLRATAVLVGTAIAGFAAAMLRGFA